MSKDVFCVLATKAGTVPIFYNGSRLAKARSTAYQRFNIVWSVNQEKVIKNGGKITNQCVTPKSK